MKVESSFNDNEANKFPLPDIAPEAVTLPPRFVCDPTVNVCEKVALPPGPKVVKLPVIDTDPVNLCSLLLIYQKLYYLKLHLRYFQLS